ncbi:MAG: sigma-70 family RNA polymerase sigma factor [Ruminococcus sp.]|nr:sigma-70 family RNA polymerase sigma factor [Ruminococcus sp.]
MIILTPELIKSYIKLEYELDDLVEEIKRIRGQRAVSVVKGSCPDYPYTEHSVKVSGYKDDAISQLMSLLEKRDRLKAQMSEIRQFVDSIPDVKVRRIVKLRYIYDKSWNEIADRLGKRNTENSVRKICERFLKKL